MRSHRVSSRNAFAFRCSVGVLVVVLACTATSPELTAVEDRVLESLAKVAPATPRVSPSYGNLPVSFEPNVGQAPEGVRFLTRGTAASLTATGAVLEGGATPVTLEFVGASTSAIVTGTNDLAGKANYLVGNDPSAWKTNVPTFASVRVEQLYPGVDLVWYGKGRSLECDLVIEPGVDSRAVSFSLGGAPSPEIDPDGALVAGDVRFERPVAYQEVDGVRRAVPCGYVTNDEGRVGFRLSDYDRSLQLVIDPEIGYTYTFADSSKDISIFGIAVDSTGAAYVAGRTRTAGAGGVLTIAAFVAKLNPEGTDLVYSTTISGSAGNEEARDIAVDATGNAFITGYTFSSNFPTTAGAFQTTKGSPNGTQDAFVAKLGPNGDTFVYSSFLGGSGGTSGNRIAIDGAGNAHVTGFTLSSNFPTTSPSQGTFGGVRDAFLTKVNPAGSAKMFSTYLGGSQSDTGNDVAVDASGNACVVGVTTSTNFPVSTGTIQSTNGGGSEAFWAKYDSTGQRVASTYLGGSGFDSANGVAVDAAGNSYLTGETASPEFPLVSPVQSTIAGDRDVFVAELNATGTALGFSTFYGGSLYDYGTSTAIDEAGRVYVVGTTRSSTFPTVDPVQATFGGGMSDLFVLRLDPGVAARGGGLVADFATFFGGPGRDESGGAGFGPDGQLLTGVNQPAESGGSQNDQGQVTEFVLPTEPRSDLILSAFQSTYLPVSEDALLAITAVVRSDACGFPSPPPIPNATFTIRIPAPYGYRRVTNLTPGVELVSAPDVGESGDVVFRYGSVVPASGVSATVEIIGASGGIAHVDVFAETDPDVRECTSANNRAEIFIPPPALFLPGARGLQITLPATSPNSAPPSTSLTLNASIPGATGGRQGSPARSFNVYSSAQPNVQPVPGNLFASLAPGVTAVDVSATPAGSFFVVTSVSDAGESAPSNEVGGILPTLTKLKVSASKITGQGTGFVAGVRVHLGGLPFAVAPKLKKANTKVVQGGLLITGQSVGSFSSQSLSSGAKVLVYFVNPNGNGVVGEYTVP